MDTFIFNAMPAGATELAGRTCGGCSRLIPIRLIPIHPRAHPSASVLCWTIPSSTSAVLCAISSTSLAPPEALFHLSCRFGACTFCGTHLRGGRAGRAPAYQLTSTPLFRDCKPPAWRWPRGEVARYMCMYGFTCFSSLLVAAVVKLCHAISLPKTERNLA